LTFNWAEFLRLAETLHGALTAGDTHDHNEALLRTAVSRAYYAAFAMARNRLRDVEGLSMPSDVNANRTVARFYERAGDVARAEIGFKLRRLREDRNRCDYDDEVIDLAAIAADSLARAADVLALLR